MNLSSFFQLHLNHSPRTASAVCIVQVRLKESETALLEIQTICSLVITDHQSATCRSVFRAASHSPHSLSSSGCQCSCSWGAPIVTLQNLLVAPGGDIMACHLHLWQKRGWTTITLLASLLHSIQLYLLSLIAGFPLFWPHRPAKRGSWVDGAGVQRITKCLLALYFSWRPWRKMLLVATILTIVSWSIKSKILPTTW